MEGNFSVQKSPISGVALGCDHALKQVHCGEKSRGGLKGITKIIMQESDNILWLQLLNKSPKNYLKKVMQNHAQRFSIIS